MISGGNTNKLTTFYDYRNNQWSVGPLMVRGRGYHAHTLLANGEVLAYGGSWSGNATVDKAGEVWSPMTNAWRVLTGVPSLPAQTVDVQGQYRADNHYWLFLAPNGKVRQRRRQQRPYK
jgi:galactose oxidase